MQLFNWKVEIFAKILQSALKCWPAGSVLPAHFKINIDRAVFPSPSSCLCQRSLNHL